MAQVRGDRVAFGKPGIKPRWTQGNKDGVGTAYSGDSRVWFTIFQGVITEVFYPTVDRPQIRDLQYLVSDGETFFHEEKRHLAHHVERSSTHALCYRITNSDPEGRYEIVKEVITHPHSPCLLQHTKINVRGASPEKLRFYVLCAPHLEVGGWGNNGFIMETAGRPILAAEKDGTWLAIAATVGFRRLSCGYVGQSDGWTDLAGNYHMDWEFDQARDGNIALTAELEPESEFTLGMAFGGSFSSAVTALFQSLAIPFEKHHERYQEQWERPYRRILPLQENSHDGGNLYHSSYSLLLSHEDKTFPGAFIASMSIPWGEARGDKDQGGYHLVWTRDLVNTAMGLLAAGNKTTPLRALIYLAASQAADGRLPQNFWVDGRKYWGGIQLDEVAFPVLLAWRLKQENALEDFDPFVLVKRAAAFLVTNGPETGQERWEEASGYSPSTIAACIAALVCASCFCRERRDEATARFLEDSADFLEGHIERWMVTGQGNLVPGIRRHFIRILPVDVDEPWRDEDPDQAWLVLANQPPGGEFRFPARDIVDPGFLELVRYGIRSPRDPVILDSLRVVDALLKVETPFGPCWHRYNHDGYGQKDDGGPYVRWGQGRAWPLLTGERGHYELSAGNDISNYVQTMERFASQTGLLTEQIWDEPDRPEVHMYLGRPTTAAMPLMWAHAEYIKLLRSARDGRVFDSIPEVAARYQNGTRRLGLEIWKSNRQPRWVDPGTTLRIQAASGFCLHWSVDEWKTVLNTESSPTSLGVEFVDIAILQSQRAPVRFTFWWKDGQRWEGKDYRVDIRAR